MNMTEDVINFKLNIITKIDIDEIYYICGDYKMKYNYNTTFHFLNTNFFMVITYNHDDGICGGWATFGIHKIRLYEYNNGINFKFIIELDFFKKENKYYDFCEKINNLILNMNNKTMTEHNFDAYVIKTMRQKKIKKILE